MKSIKQSLYVTIDDLITQIEQAAGGDPYALGEEVGAATAMLIRALVEVSPWRPALVSLELPGSPQWPCHVREWDVNDAGRLVPAFDPVTLKLVSEWTLSLQQAGSSFAYWFDQRDDGAWMSCSRLKNGQMLMSPMSPFQTDDGTTVLQPFKGNIPWLVEELAMEA